MVSKALLQRENYYNFHENILNEGYTYLLISLEILQR